MNDFGINDSNEFYRTLFGKISNTTSTDYFTYVNPRFNFWKDGLLVSSEEAYLDYDTYRDYGLVPGSFGLFSTLCQKVEFDSVSFAIQYSPDNGSGFSLNKDALVLTSTNFVDFSYTTAQKWIGEAINVSNTTLNYPGMFACFYLDDKLVHFEEAFLDIQDSMMEPNETCYFTKLFTPPAAFDSIQYLSHYSIDLTGYAELPVELTSFTAKQNGNEIILNWATCSETNNYCFQVERKSGDAEWQTIGQIQGYGTTTENHHYQFTDNYHTIETVYYRLKQIDFDGKSTLYDEIEITIVAPCEFQLAQNYPNPFNNTTKIKYSVAEAAQIQLYIYDLTGREIMLAVNAYQQPGDYSATIDMKNFPSGMYFYKLISPSQNLVKSMMLVK